MIEYWELAAVIITVISSVYAGIKWYNHTVESRVVETSDTQATRLIVNELNTSLTKLTARVTKLENKQGLDEKLHQEVEQLLREFLQMKGQFNLLYALISKEIKTNIRR